jgi:hypothetical protein
VVVSHSHSGEVRADKGEEVDVVFERRGVADVTQVRLIDPIAAQAEVYGLEALILLRQPLAPGFIITDLFAERERVSGAEHPDSAVWDPAGDVLLTSKALGVRVKPGSIPELGQRQGRLRHPAKQRIITTDGGARRSLCPFAQHD